MKAKRFSEEQINGVLKEGEAGAKAKDRGGVPQLESQMCREDGVGGAAAEGA